MFLKKSLEAAIFFIAICTVALATPPLSRKLSPFSREPTGLNRPPPSSIQFSPPYLPQSPLKIGFYNLLTTHITDNSEKNNLRYPQYQWNQRCKPLIDLIRRERPAVLGLCELDLKQIETLHTEIQQEGKLEGYALYGFSAENRMTLEETLATFKLDQHPLYGECVGFLFDTQQVELCSISCVQLPKGKVDTEEAWQKWNRILVKADFIDLSSGVYFTCLASHFDHQSLEGRIESAAIELAIIETLEEQKIPWFSLSDRNWQADLDGETCYKTYIQHSYVSDFRDHTDMGEYGMPGSFPSYNQHRDIICLKDGTEIIDAPTIDVCFYSISTVKALYYQSETGEFDPSTLELLPTEKQEGLSKRFFPSDHYYISGAFQFKDSAYKQSNAPFTPESLESDCIEIQNIE